MVSSWEMAGAFQTDLAGKHSLVEAISRAMTVKYFHVSTKNGYRDWTYTTYALFDGNFLVLIDDFDNEN